MNNITDIYVPYSLERGGVRTLSGTSAGGGTGTGANAGASEHALYNHYNVWIPGCDLRSLGGYESDLYLSFPSVSDISSYAGSKVLEYNSGVSNFRGSVFAYFRRPRLWRDGKVSMRIHYTGVGDTGTTFKWQLSILIRNATYYTSGAYESVSMPCPTSDGEWMTYKWDESASGLASVTVAADTEQADGIILSMEQATQPASNAYQEDLYIIGLEVIFIPNGGVGTNTTVPAYLSK